MNIKKKKIVLSSKVPIITVNYVYIITNKEGSLPCYMLGKGTYCFNYTFKITSLHCLILNSSFGSYEDDIFGSLEFVFPFKIVLSLERQFAHYFKKKTLQ